MYIPNHYQWKDRDEIFDFINAFPLATLITQLNNQTTASHLPFAIQKDNELELNFISHFANTNPQSKNISGKQAMLIFAGPNAYISPTLYERKQNVPTWNYIAVHCYGKIQIINSEAKKLQGMVQIINEFEPNYFEQWNLLSDKYKQAMLNPDYALENLLRSEIASKQNTSLHFSI